MWRSSHRLKTRRRGGINSGEANGGETNGGKTKGGRRRVQGSQWLPPAARRRPCHLRPYSLWWRSLPLLTGVLVKRGWLKMVLQSKPRSGNMKTTQSLTLRLELTEMTFLSPAAELGLDAGTHCGTARGPAMEPVGPLEPNPGSTEAIAVDVDVPASSSTVVSSPEMLPVGRPPTPPRARRKRRRRPSSSSSELRPDDEGGRYEDLENYNRREDESTLDYHRRCLAQAIAYAAARGMHKKSDFECFVPLICMLPHHLAGMCMLACLLYATKCKPRPWWIVVRPLPGHFVRRNLSTGRSCCRQSMKKYYSKPRAPPGPSQKEGQQVTRRPGSVLPTDVCYHTIHHVRASWGPKSPGRPYIALRLILLCILPSYGEGMYVATEPRVATEAAAVAGAQNQVLQRASLSWNVGGLTTAILDELMLWLDQPANSGIAFVLLQETRWTYTAEWCTASGV